MTTLAVTSVNSLLCQDSTCFRIGSKFRCIRSTPTERQSTSENDFECLARTGVNTPGTMFPCQARVLVETWQRSELRDIFLWCRAAARGNRQGELTSQIASFQPTTHCS